MIKYMDRLADKYTVNYMETDKIRKEQTFHSSTFTLTAIIIWSSASVLDDTWTLRSWTLQGQDSQINNRHFSSNTIKNSHSPTCALRASLSLLISSKIRSDCWRISCKSQKTLVQMLKKLSWKKGHIILPILSPPPPPFFFHTSLYRPHPLFLFITNCNQNIPNGSGFCATCKDLFFARQVAREIIIAYKRA